MKLKRNKAGFPENPVVNEEKPVGKKVSVWYILVAFIAAVMLWFYVADYDTVVEKTFPNVPVEIIYPEKKDIVVESGEGEHVSVTVRGKKADVNKMKAKDIRAYVDLSGVQKDYDSFDAEIMTKLPAGVTLVENKALSVSHINVRLVIRKQKELELEVEMIYSRDMNYDLIPECTPKKIKIWGSSSVIDQVERAYVKIDLGNIERAKLVMCDKDKIVLKDSGGNEIPQTYIKITDTDSKDIQEVQVYVGVIMEKELPLEVEFTGGVFKAEDAIIKCVPETVTVRGGVERLKKMDSIKLPVNETEIDDRSVFSMPWPELPENVEFKDDEIPETVEVDIKLIDYRTTKLLISTDDIEVLGLPEGLTARLSFRKDEDGKIPKRVGITVRGYRKSILSLKREQLKKVTLSVDFSEFSDSEEGIKAGQVYESLPVSVSFPDLAGVFTTDRIEVRAEITEAPEESDEG